MFVSRGSEDLTVRPVSSENAGGSKEHSPIGLRSFLLAFGSAALAISLLTMLVWASKIDLHTILVQLKNVRQTAFLELVLLIGLQSFLSAQKWRLVDSVVRQDSEPALPIAATFAMTSIGLAFGHILPLSVSMVAARTLGIYGRNKALQRSTIGTLFDQGFDFLIVCLLVPASAITRFLHGGAKTWIGIAVPTISVAFLALSLGTWLLDRLAGSIARTKSLAQNRFGRTVIELKTSGTWHVSLVRKLFALSCVRFLVLVFMAGRTTEAIGASVPLWHLAAAMPFVVISTVMALTPGGLGVNELTFAVALSSFGTPLHAAAEWALANRLLVAVSSFVVAICAVIVHTGIKRLSSRNRDRLEPQLVR